MFELIRVSQNSYYIQSPAKIGLFMINQNQACLIDSGNDKDAGKKIKKILDSNGWSLKAIFLTHSHADHMGGSCYLQKQTGCKIYAAGTERAFAERPVLEPAFLFGGNPPPDLRHKFLMAQACDVLPLTEASLPSGLQAIPLPGHSWDMTGFQTRDGVVFLADCLASPETLNKYKITYLTDVSAYLATLGAIQSIAAKLFIPAHAEPSEDIAPLARLNIQTVHQIAGTILEICAEPAGFETILKRLFDSFGLAMTFEQHALVGSTVRSYLAWLRETGRLQASIQNNTLVWSV